MLCCLCQHTYPHLCKSLSGAEVEHQGGGLLPASFAKQQASQEAGEKPPSKGALQKLHSHREASAGTRTSSFLGEQRRSHNALPAEQPKRILSSGAAGSSSHPCTAEQDAGLAHLSPQHRRLCTAPAREIRAVASKNQGGLLCAGQLHFSPPKMTSTSSCPAARPAQAGGEEKEKASWHPPQPSTGWKCWQHKAKGRAVFCT